MVSFRELGLYNTKKMFEVALARKFAIPGYNASNLEDLQGIIIGCGESNSPVIIQITPSSLEYTTKSMISYLGKGCVELAKDLGYINLETLNELEEKLNELFAKLSKFIEKAK